MGVSRDDGLNLAQTAGQGNRGPATALCDNFSPMDSLSLARPDDWHLHLRDGDALRHVLAHSAAQFSRAIVMPNLRPPVTTTALAKGYRSRILDALPKGMKFEPLMTLYLTDGTSPDEIDRAADSGIIHGVKLYPAGATTHSDAGVTRLINCHAALDRMAERGLPLLVHGEVTDPEVDVFDREAQFIERDLAPLTARLPMLKVVFEHITTKDAVQFVRAARATVAATITPQHLMFSRNALFQGGLRPHHYCLPVLKREQHRRAVLEAAISSNPKFFLGTDSAPHARGAKEAACGCAGIYSAHAALPLYAQIFENAGALDKLEGFASQFGADFYGLPRNQDRITLRRLPWTVPGHYPFTDGDQLIPLCAGETLQWKLA
jgi:dihydroorotase